ncbi:hypothetical protein CRM22_007262 [Opisthorchis felineus]|uniref:LITAF domain-containing protein n=1 Tax=Opisthorchis felineus TaxID=147828 RepID=A0A4S2LIS8_OPIFE|nr:hypothetical protein CRM22_007262 [Opisthorchis felineus]
MTDSDSKVPPYASTTGTPQDFTFPPYPPENAMFQDTTMPPYPTDDSTAEVGEIGIEMQPTAVPTVPLTSFTKTETVCPHCGKSIKTSVKYRVGALSWVLCGIIALLGGIFGCCLIPLCSPCCMDVVHSCPTCRKVIATVSRI